MYELIRSVYAARKQDDLRSVLLNFAADLGRLRELVEASLAKTGDRELPEVRIRRHPICVLYGERIAQLTGAMVGDRASKAIEWCEFTLQRESLPFPPVPIPQDSN